MAYDSQKPDQPVSDTDAAIRAGVSIGTQGEDPEATAFVVIPTGYKLESLEQFRSAPRRIERSVIFTDAESFVTYSRLFWSNAAIVTSNSGAALAATKNEDSPEIRFAATLDYHQPGLPAWCSHTAELRLIFSREWRMWTSANKRKMGHSAFVEFIESNMLDIREPESARLIEIIRQFEVKKLVNFATAKNLDNGDVQFVYEEVSSGTSAKGVIDMPSAITLGLRVFEGGEAYRVPTKLRWKLDGQQLLLWIDLLAYHRYEYDAVASIASGLKTSLGAPILQVP